MPRPLLPALAMACLLALAPAQAPRVEWRPVDPLEAARDALRPFGVEIGRQTAPRDRPLFVLHADRASVLARIELEPLEPGPQPVRFYLHGQPAEAFRLDPGRYRLHLAFWRPGQPWPQPYPHTTEFRLRPGDRAEIDFDRDELGQIKKWIDARAGS